MVDGGQGLIDVVVGWVGGWDYGGGGQRFCDGVWDGMGWVFLAKRGGQFFFLGDLVLYTCWCFWVLIRPVCVCV